MRKRSVIPAVAAVLALAAVLSACSWMHKDDSMGTSPSSTTSSSSSSSSM